VLASHCGGLPESVGPGGILVERDAPFEHWRAALSRMWDDADTYDALVESARRHAQRPEIQPKALVGAFIACVSDHVQRCSLPPGHARQHTAALPTALNAPATKVR
jgi:glycosyltransferase involved in cell wall biosynthesis